MLSEKWSWVETDSEVFSEALEAILCSEENLFILGMGGTGKSILLRIAYDHFPNALVLGSTGISSANLVAEGVPATTIHSALKIPPVSVLDHNHVSFSSDAMELLERTSLILIDEVSMVNASLMDFLLKMFLSSGKEKPRVILFGDLFQLPPVINNKDKDIVRYFQDKYDDGRFFFHAKLYRAFRFRTIHLDEVYRQKDPVFKEALNRIRIGMPTDADLALINTRVVKDRENFIQSNPYMLYLASTNKVVDSLNDTYTKSDTFNKRMVYHAEISGDYDLRKNPIVKERVEIAVGQQVMCLFNNYIEGYQNGTLGRVQYVLPEKVGIITSDGERKEVKMDTWNNYEFVFDEKSGRITHKAVGSCKQIGCKPAFAVTFHKSQGLSLDSVFIDLDSYFIPESGVYLALSRCRTLEGIGLSRPLREKDISVNPEALEFLGNYLQEQEIVYG